MIVQADELLALSTVLVAPTSQSAPARTFRPTIELEGQATRVLVEQTTAITPDPPSEVRNLDGTLTLVLGI